MATTALTIIKKALRLVRVLDRNQPLQDDDRNDALEAFNQMILHIQTNYNNLWTMKQAVVLMEQGKQFYKCGPAGDRVVARDDLRIQTTAGVEVAGSASILMNGPLTVAAGDTVGIQMSNNVFYWTAASVASTGTTITIPPGLPVDANASARVYVYTDIIDRPLRILNAQSAWSITDSEIPLETFSRKEYFDQPDKTTQGQTSNYYYSPQLTAGELYVWPTAQSSLNVLRMTYVEPIETMITNIDAPQFPDEWQECLAYMLATRIMDEYGVEQDRQMLLKAKADEMLNDNLAFDNDADPMVVELYRW